MKADSIISEKKSIKRRIDILENDVEMNNINEEAILKKDPNKEIVYKAKKALIMNHLKIIILYLYYPFLLHTFCIYLISLLLLI